MNEEEEQLKAVEDVEEKKSQKNGKEDSLKKYGNEEKD